MFKTFIGGKMLSKFSLFFSLVILSTTFVRLVANFPVQKSSSFERTRLEFVSGSVVAENTHKDFTPQLEQGAEKGRSLFSFNSNAPEFFPASEAAKMSSEKLYSDTPVNTQPYISNNTTDHKDTFTDKYNTLKSLGI